ncbi:MAG: hypothetical protein BGN88_09810 [Clostridiales bacterium 43-6]|nr:MAG: hypothetical protein BGN88_09810 [Clostridiales bacterium 43-6]
MKKILFINQNPPIKSISKVAYALSILLEYPSDYLYLINNFIDLKCDINGNNIEFVDKAINFSNHNLFTTYSIKIPTQSIVNIGNDILNLILNLINDGYYVHGIANLIDYYDRSYLIYGYDDDKKILHTINHVKEGFYGKSILTYDNYLNSLKLNDKNSYIGFIRKLNNNTHNVSILDIKGQIQNYAYIHNDSSILQGKNVFKKQIELLSNTKKYEKIEMKPFNILVEHKRLMADRIKYLIYTKGLDQKYLQKYQNIIKKAVYINNSCKMYNNSLNNKQIPLIQNNIQLLLKEEFLILDEIIESYNSKKI